MRRKFFDVHAAGCSLVAEQALQRIAKLYAIEQQDTGLDQPQRMLLHEQPTLSALAELHTWLLANQRTVATATATATAAARPRGWTTHALDGRQLQRYATYDILPIDNNPVDYDIRPVPIRKKSVCSSDRNAPVVTLSPSTARSRANSTRKASFCSSRIT